jgi:integrase
MATIRTDTRKDGTTAHRVFFRHNKQQTCLTFDDPDMAEMFRAAIDRLGAARALELHRIERAPRRDRSTELTVEQWLNRHIDHLTGVQQGTIDAYRGYVRNDIGPVLGVIPLAELGEHDVALWVQGLEDADASPKTIANKHGFLSGALAAAVPKHIAANPAAGRRLPRGDGDDHEMVFLTRAEFATLLAAVTEPWRPMIEFLVASGCRLGEATALRPDDVDRAASTVRIARAWKRSHGGYQIGPPKTKRSKRTINMPAGVLKKLDLGGEWLFTNPGRGRRNAGGPVRPINLRRNVWYPAVERAELDPPPRIHDLRHTCASWLIAAGVPLPVVSRHLGHESIQVTVDVYGHIDRTSAQAAADAMGDMLSE